MIYNFGAIWDRENTLLVLETDEVLRLYKYNYEKEKT